MWKKKELVIIKALIPSTDIFQDKSDTYRRESQFSFGENIHKQSDTLLNKWLKESK